MKPLNLLQNMSAEAKVLAMALPMLLLSAMSAMAKQDEGYYYPEKMDMPYIVTQPGDTTSAQPVEQPDKNGRWAILPAQTPEDAGLDHWYVGRGFPGPPVSSDSASAQPVDYRKYKFPGQKPEDAGLDSFKEDALLDPIPSPWQVSPDSVNVEPAQKPEVDRWITPCMPNVTNDEPEEDGLMIPTIPGDEDVYESVHISDSQQYRAGIAEVAVENQPAKAPQGVFALSGLRVSESADLSGLAPGLYIVNGKKMLVQ